MARVERTVETVELTAERIAAGGDAVARESSGRVVFLPGALPGERVRARITEEKRDYARAELIEVLTAAPGRVDPPCPFVAAGCGGCRWQHVDPATQSQLKVAIVGEALIRTGGLAEPDVVMGHELPTTGFRTTIRVATVASTANAGRPGPLGFRRHHAHDVVAVDHCLVAHPRLSELMVVPFPGAQEVTLRCGAATGERLAVVTPGRVRRPAALPADTGFGPDAVLHEVVHGVRLRISGPSFFQTRLDGAEALVDAVRAAVDHADRLAGIVVDAYGGVGLFAAVAFPEDDVVVLEGSTSSCADARHNLTGRTATVVEGPVERWRAQPAAVVVADPARTGLGRGGVTSLVAARAPVFVLVSCDPVALARDARLLGEHGYHHVRSTVVDLFPHTPHVEVVTVFRR